MTWSGLRLYRGATLLFIASLLLSGCSAQVSSFSQPVPDAAQPVSLDVTPEPDASLPTPFPTRPLYEPGELVDYTAQPGDTLPALAVRFNTTVEEILQANDFIPSTATTMPPGMPMKIPIYYLPLWGSPYKIIPDSLFINGPAQANFNTQEFVDQHPGWLKNYVEYASDANRSGANIIDLIALNYSVSPRLLLALLEYQSGALSDPTLTTQAVDYPLGYRDFGHKRLFMQLGWAANQLNNAYYGWRLARLTSIELGDGRLERFDPWQNAATVSLHAFFNRLLPDGAYEKAIAPEGFAQTYAALFGDPWQADQPHIPGSLTQPEFGLPFEPGEVWAYTGGPHTGWGLGEPLAAIDFAPPSVGSGCISSAVWATAVAPGVIARSRFGEVVLDIDGDGDERTGWVIFYLHVGSEGRVAQGTVVERGDRIGHPSCEGGSSTGTHIHIARKYNGEWIPAGGITGVLAFSMDNWLVENGDAVYQGRMRRFTDVVTACQCSNAASFIQSSPR